MKLVKGIIAMLLIVLSRNAKAGQILAVDMDKVRDLERGPQAKLEEFLAANGIAVVSTDGKFLYIDTDKMNAAMAKVSAQNDGDTLSVLQTLMNEAIPVQSVDPRDMVNGTQDMDHT